MIVRFGFRLLGQIIDDDVKLGSQVGGHKSLVVKIFGASLHCNEFLFDGGFDRTEGVAMDKEPGRGINYLDAFIGE